MCSVGEMQRAGSSGPGQLADREGILAAFTSVRSDQ